METIINSNVDENEYTIEQYFNDFEEYTVKCKTNKNIKFIDEEVNMKLIKKFIENKIDIYINNEQSLMINCIIWYINVVKLSIEHGEQI